MAITIRNLESSFRGAKNRTSAPAAADTVVITEASHALFELLRP